MVLDEKINLSELYKAARGKWRSIISLITPVLVGGPKLGPEVQVGQKKLSIDARTPLAYDFKNCSLIFKNRPII